MFLVAGLGFAQTVTIGTGTSFSGGTQNGNPIYRSSTTSSFHHSKSVQLVTAADLSTAGVSPGALITEWGYERDADGLGIPQGSNAWTLNVYLKNSSSTALASGTSWNDMIAGATLAYTTTINSGNMPAVAGFWMWPTSGFTYTGGAIECLIEWFPVGAVTSPFTTDDFAWRWETTPTVQAMGTSNNLAIPGTQTAYTTLTRRYNTRLTYSATPCAGTPSLGATTGPAGLVCGADAIVLGVANPPTGTGLTYVWEISTDGGTTWNPAGPNSSTWSTTQSVTTSYRLTATCTEPGGGSDTSIPLEVVSDVPANCYCEPIYTSGKTFGDLISNVEILGTTLANNTGTAPVNPAYTYFTGQPNYTADLQAGTTYTLEVSNGSFSGQNIAVWIDFNGNGVFETPAERIGTGAIPGANSSVQFPIALPCDPTPGTYRMRVRDVWNLTPTLIDPCATYGFGETEDYDVTVLPPPACPTPSFLSATNITQNEADLGWNIGCAEITWDVHIQAAGGGTPPATPSNPGVTQNPYPAMGLTAGFDYEFWVRADCDVDGTSAWAGPFAFSTLVPPAPNDECINATPIPVGAGVCIPVTSYNDGATDSGVPHSCANYVGGDVWFSVEVPASGEVNIDMTVNGGFTDGGMEAYSGTCAGPLTSLGCSDDVNGLMPALALTGLTPGSTIYVAAWEFGNNAFGTFDICAYEPVPPANDECVNAETVTVHPDNTFCPAGGVFGSNALATAGADVGCLGAGPDVWYTFTANGTGTGWTFSSFTLASLWVEIFEGTCGGTPVGCYAGINAIENGFLSTPGQTYVMRVVSAVGGTGSFNLCMYDADVYDPCANITVVSCDTPTGPVVADPGPGQWSNSSLPGPNQSPGEEHVFSFTASTTGNHLLDFTQLTGGPVEIYYKEADACNDLGWTYLSQAAATGVASGSLALTASVEYYIMWDATTTTGRTVDFTVLCPGPPPANDDCANEVPTLIAIGGSASFSGNVDWSTVDASIAPLFNLAVVSGVAWESFEIDDCAEVTLEFCGNPYNGSGGSASFLVNACDATGLISPDATNLVDCGDGQETATYVLGPGQYYVPMLWAPGLNVGGDYSLTISAAASAACSSCSNATPIDCATGIIAGSTTGLPNTLPPTACPVQGPASTGGTVWYSFSTPTDQLVTLSTCVEDGLATSFDTRLSVFEGTCGGTLCCVAYNDDGAGCSAFTSRLNFEATANVTYFVVVHGYGTGEGNYELFVGCAPACSPEATNDICSDADPLTPYLADGSGIITVGDNTCATADPNPACDPFGPLQGVWYSFNSGSNENMQLTLLTSDEDGSYTSANGISYALYAGCDMSVCPLGGDGPELDCSIVGGGTSVLPTLTTNTDYVLNVWNDGGIGTAGTFGVLLEYPGQNDAGISQVISPDGNICTTQVGPVVELTNFGAQPLTSVVITYTVDAGTPVVFNWTGNLAYQESEQVTLPVASQLVGPHTLDVSTSLPNGVADEIPGNDAINGTAFDVGGEEVNVVIVTDRWGSETTWTLYAGDGVTVVANGGPYTDQGAAGSYPQAVETFCLPVAFFANTYYFLVEDVFGDGMCCTYGTGSWSLTNAAGGVLLTDVFYGSGTGPDAAPPVTGDQSPDLAPLSPGYGDFLGLHKIMLPVALAPGLPTPTPPAIESSECGIFTNNLQSKVYCESVSGANEYQFEFNDPDAGFSRRIKVPRNWVKFGEMVSVPLVPGVHYFARARADDPNGIPGLIDDDAWGPGCEVGIDPNLVPGCTQLIDDPGPTLSCDQVRTFGGSDKIWAIPVVGATQYRFRFEGTGPLTGFARNIARSNYVCVLNWVTLPLDPGVYDVSVEVLVNGQWSGFCGNVCPLTIVDPPAFAGRDLSEADLNGVTLWPNPVRDGNVHLMVDGLTEADQRITVDMYDMFGKRVIAQAYENTGEQLNTTLEVDGLAAGVYVVHISTGERSYTERISVQ